MLQIENNVLAAPTELYTKNVLSYCASKKVICYL